MISVLSGAEIFTMLTAALLLGGGMGVITGWIVNKVLSRFRQPLKASLLLGIVGYWAGAYVSSVIWQTVTGNGAAVKIYLLAALVGSAVVTVIGSIGISSLHRINEA